MTADVCTFPSCPNQAGARNRAGQATCLVHIRVQITGSWMDSERHEDDA